jgi:hypothetical protein
MKNQLSNIALEGTHSGDVVVGLFIVDRGKPIGAFRFELHGLGAAGRKG